MRKLSFVLFALVVAGAVGYLLWSAGSSIAPRTVERTSAPEAARPAAASDAPKSGPSAAELAIAAPLDVTAEERSDAANAARTDVTIKARLKGRVALSTRTPADEALEVFAVTAAKDRSALTEIAQADAEQPSKELLGRAPVAADGTFELPLTQESGTVHVFAFGRYASSRATVPAQVEVPGSSGPGRPSDPSEAMETLSVPVELGTWIRGTLALPANAEESERDALGEVAISVGGSGTQAWNTQMGGGGNGENRSVRSQDGRTFELRSLYGTSQFTLFARPEGKPDALPRFAAGRSEPTEASPGSRRDVTIAFSRGGALTGRVQDENGAPVADVKVEARIDPKMMGMGGDVAREAKSGSDGTFSLAAVRAGKAKLQLEKSGYLMELHDIEIVDGETRDGGDFELTHGGHVSGVVLWSNRTPAAGAKVTLGFDMAALTGLNAFNAWRGNEGSATAGADGAFTIGGLGGGPFGLRAEAPPAGVEDKKENAERFWRASLAGVAPGTEGLELVLAAPEGVQGRVVDESGAPVTRFELVARAEVRSLIPGIGGPEIRRSFEADDGRFVLAGLDRGGWELFALAPGFGDAEPVQVELPRESSAAPVELVLVHAATVAGVVYGPDGQPVAGAIVQRSIEMADIQRRFRPTNEPQRAVTIEDGSFTFAPLSAGRAGLVARAEGAASSERVDVEVAPAEKKSGVEIRLRRGGTLTGEIYGDDGKPKASANVLAQESAQRYAQRMVRSDSQGRFREEHLEPGTWQVIYMAWMSDDGGMPEGADTASMLGSMKMTTATIKDGEETHVTLGAPPKNPVRVHGHVRSHGEAVGGVTLNFMADGTKGLAGLKFVSVAADGSYETRLDGAGRYLITVQSFGNAGEQQAYEFARRIPQEPEHVLDIELPGARISGRVLDDEGRPALRARVSLTARGAVPNGTLLGGRYSEITTDEDGRYVMRWLEPGDYTISAGGALFGGILGADKPLGREVRDVSVAGDTDLDGIDFRLERSGSVSGIVRATNGQPVEGAAIFVRDENERLLERLSLSQTGSDGRYTYLGLAEGRYTVTARAKGSASAAAVGIAIKSGETTEADLVVEAATLLVVKLVDSKETEVAADVLVTDEKGRQVNGLLTVAELMAVFQEGGFSSNEQRIGPLAPGLYTVTATAPDGRSANKTVSLGGEAERKLTLRLRE
ncbi:MAG: carboxypeptidase regulatory-like domain-containing protein [Planctomycetes bacterium]|nr:carboxypeptidase regulatory-like domain-containing protein [Planctomycetota bacterium]